jgi:hypothetical protein
MSYDPTLWMHTVRLAIMSANSQGAVPADLPIPADQFQLVINQQLGRWPHGGIADVFALATWDRIAIPALRRMTPLLVELEARSQGPPS